MAAVARCFPCANLLRYSCASRLNLIENRSIALSVIAVRHYRGSNRDTRRRERNERTRQRKREGKQQKIFDKREFIKINYDTELFAFKNRLSLANMDDSSLKIALTHESYNNQESENNSKLALIGYNLVGHYITEYFCFKHPSFPSEGLRCLLDFLTCRETIVKLAESFALPELIRTEYDLDNLDQEKHLGYSRDDIVSDAFYALIGAIYKDQGSQEANMFIRDFVLTHLQGEDLHSLLKFKDPEKLLNEILLSEGKPKSEPRIIRESGKKTNIPVFVVGVFCADVMLGEAASYNITKAKREATLAALMKLIHRDTKHQPSLPSHNVTLQSLS